MERGYLVCKTMARWGPSSAPNSPPLNPSRQLHHKPKFEYDVQKIFEIENAAIAMLKILVLSVFILALVVYVLKI